MLKASRFLDTTLKVSEFEHREKIYDLEIDAAIHQKENELLREDFYDTVLSEKKDSEKSKKANTND